MVHLNGVQQGQFEPFKIERAVLNLRAEHSKITHLIGYHIVILGMVRHHLT